MAGGSSNHLPETGIIIKRVAAANPSENDDIAQPEGIVTVWKKKRDRKSRIATATTKICKDSGSKISIRHPPTPWLNVWRRRRRIKPITASSLSYDDHISNNETEEDSRKRKRNFESSLIDRNTEWRPGNWYWWQSWCIIKIKRKTTPESVSGNFGANFQEIYNNNRNHQ